MFSNDQVNQFQARVQETFAKAQKRAQSRVREMEEEARKAFELFGDRAQAEAKVLLSHAQGATREQLGVIGAELVKLGNKLQELAKAAQTQSEAAVTPAASAAEPAAAAAEAAKIAAAAGQPN